jgi:hypothetical protein
VILPPVKARRKWIPNGAALSGRNRVSPSLVSTSSGKLVQNFSFSSTLLSAPFVIVHSPGLNTIGSLGNRSWAQTIPLVNAPLKTTAHTPFINHLKLSLNPRIKSP